ncbi:fumarylacetoacetate hydrolase [Larkinella arboricola]|uniref:fumarylacetoacetase n=1 Tax=Larkinella arboricola TaxID=643671 RepID=A0A327XB64_LARAB|nr:fumarylacetoacetase [Larkinella arboricola]RAK03113.1 fumarylacetoacetate hydrolase [Larkinella arboricola]
MTLPYGIFSTDGSAPRVGVRIDDQILDLGAVGRLGFFDDLTFDQTVFDQPVLNPFMELGKPVHRAIRQRLLELLAHPEKPLDAFADQVRVPAATATLHLPIRIGDYTDFYASQEHASNVGRMFRPQTEPLLPNWKHLPVAYHGRASSIVVSGTPVKRPSGQFLDPDQQPVFGPTQALDFELELGIVIGKPSALGEPVPVDEAESHVFGFVLFNDWSARDIQRWEYQPLGPFLGKNFASSISPWVVPLEALAPFRTDGPTQEPTPLPYLRSTARSHFDIELEVVLQPANQEEIIISRTNARHLYWSVAQLIAHHTVNGCNLNVGDVLATGTISGPTDDSCGSLLEQSWNGSRPLVLPDGSTRSFLHYGDTVILRGWAGNRQIDFGEVRGTVIS